MADDRPVAPWAAGHFVSGGNGDDGSKKVVLVGVSSCEVVGIEE